MAPVRRAKFLEAALQPALNATKRVAVAAGATRNARPDPRRHHEPNSDDDDNRSGDGGSSDGSSGGGDGDGGDVHREGVLPPPPPTAEHEMPSRAAYVAAALAAETAMDFAGPLVEQACTERALLSCAPTVATVAVAGRGEDERSRTTAVVTGARSTAGCPTQSEEAASASDLSLAAYIGFALSALELAAETSTCTAAAADSGSTAPTSSAGPAASVVDGLATPRTLQGVEDKTPAVEVLAKAEERLVELIIDGPVSFLDLQFVLHHGCRLSHADRTKRRRLRKGDGEERGRERASLSSSGCGVGLVGFGEATVRGALPWTLGGVSSLAYVVSAV